MTKSIKMIYTTLVLSLILSCQSSKKEDGVMSGPDALDTLILNSQKNFEISGKISKATDSAVTQKVDHTVKKITQMEGEIKQLKQENHELKSKLDDANDGGKPFNIRSISDN
jgi:hypothetical protein